MRTRLTDWLASRRDRKHDVAVKGCVDWTQSAGEAVGRHDCDALKLDSSHIGIDCYDRNRGVLTRIGNLHVGRQIELSADFALQATPAELAVLFERKSPKNIRARYQGRTDGIDRRQCADRETVICHRRRASESALIGSGACAKTSTSVAQRKSFAGGIKRCTAERAVGRLLAPFLVAAIGEIEEHGGRHDWRRRSDK